MKDRQHSVKQAVNDATVETKSYSAGLFDWALSSLYFTAGVWSSCVHTCSVLMTLLSGALIRTATPFHQTGCGQGYPMKLQGCAVLVMKANMPAIAHMGKTSISRQRRHASHSNDTSACTTCVRQLLHIQTISHALYARSVHGPSKIQTERPPTLSLTLWLV